MRPQPSVDYLPRTTCVDAIYSRNSGARFAGTVRFADTSYIVSRQLGGVVILSSFVSALSAVRTAGHMPALVHHVAVVVRYRSQKQVIGIHAPRIVTAMQDTEAGRDCPPMDDPREAVRAALYDLPVLAPAECTVTLAPLGCRPLPALATLANLGPEPPYGYIVHAESIPRKWCIVNANHGNGTWRGVVIPSLRIACPGPRGTTARPGPSRRRRSARWRSSRNPRRSRTR